MKKIILILILLFSTFSQGFSVSAATSEYDHQALSEYKGYGEAMYETVVEQTTFITGQYTDNKDYVNQSMDQVKDYANFWLNEKGKIEDACGGFSLFTKNCAGEIFSTGTGYMLTVGDFIKNLFNDYDASENTTTDDIDFSGYEQYFINKTSPGSRIASLEVKSGYRVDVIYKGVTTTNEAGLSIIAQGGKYSTGYKIRYGYKNEYGPYVDYGDNEGAFNAAYDDFHRRSTTISGVLNIFKEHGLWFVIKKNGVPISDIATPTPKKNPSIQKMNDYIKSGNTPQMVVPQPTAYLSCPNGTKIQMSINGGTFLHANGQVMQVSKDGTATVNNQICNLNWEKPQVQYVRDRVGITTPDDKVIDVETGELLLEDGEIDDQIEDGCGTICAIGKMLTGLGSIAKSIASIPLKILEGLFSLIVPDDLGFLTELINKAIADFNKKVDVTKELKEAITGVLDGGGGNPLSEVSISLPGASGGPLTLDTTIVETGVPILRRVISAIVILYTVLYLYRKITGRGGVMEK